MLYLTHSRATFSLAASDGGHVLEQTARSCSSSGNALLSPSRHAIWLHKNSHHGKLAIAFALSLTNCKFENGQGVKPLSRDGKTCEY
ncbi:hypothetical protein NC651_000697 [Populus alba x Populus x berolinensis]|nr:hypothetical protein NC651_000697 [Populus alba x Populus x berolinensis]